MKKNSEINLVEKEVEEIKKFERYTDKRSKTLFNY